MPSYNRPKISISTEDERNLAEYLFTELEACNTSRSEIRKLWVQIQEMYEQISVPDKKNYPFEGAAHIMIPVTPTFVEQLHARIMNTLYGIEDPYTCKPTLDELFPYAKSLKKWINWMSANELDMERVDYGAILELLKLGNMVTKTIYARETKTLYRFEEATNSYYPVVEIMKDNPEIIHISIDDYWFPAWARSSNEPGAWKAHRLRMNWNELKGKALSGLYDADQVRKIALWTESRRTDYEQERDALTLVEPNVLHEYELFEVWFQYPLKHEPTTRDSGEQPLPIDQQSMALNFSPAIDLVAVFHRDSRILVSLRYNDYPLGLDPFEHMCYVGREHQIMGIGIGQMALPFQVEISTMHNQRLDNATVSNTIAYAYKADSTIPSELRLAPGRGIPVDNPREDIVPLQLGQKYDSTITEEQHTLSFLQERIGAKELDMDQMSLSRAPASSTLALMHEKGRRLDNTIRAIRRFKKRQMLKAILLAQEYYPKEKLVKTLGQEHGMKVAELLTNMSAQDIWDGIGVEVTATTSATSKELERQSKLSLFNLLVQYYGIIAQYTQAAMSSPPPLQQLAISVVQGMSTFVSEILEDFNIRNRTEFVMDLGQAQAAAQQAGIAAAPGAVPGAGMEAVQPSAAQPGQAAAGGGA